MKTRYLITSTILLLFSLGVAAQEEETPHRQKKVSIEAHIGMNLASYAWTKLDIDFANDVWERYYKTGLLAGVGANIGKGKSYSFNPEVNYSQMGIRNKEYADSYHIKVYDDQNWKCDDRAIGDETLHYIEIPLYSKWTFGNHKVQPFVALAPSFSFAIGGTRTYITEYLRTEGDVSRKTPLFKEDKNSPYSTARYNSFDYSMRIKTGAVVAQKFVATVGFRQSLTTLLNEEHESHFSDFIDGDLLMNFFMTFGFRF